MYKIKIHSHSTRNKIIHGKKTEDLKLRKPFFFVFDILACIECRQAAATTLQYKNKPKKKITTKSFSSFPSVWSVSIRFNEFTQIHGILCIRTHQNDGYTIPYSHNKCGKICVYTLYYTNTPYNILICIWICWETQPRAQLI